MLELLLVFALGGVLGYACGWIRCSRMYLRLFRKRYDAAEGTDL